ncbi:metalloprotease TldD [Shewanella yunxiaonensis]|uniref:Metalloprotease TldD n=1 Tax=Shewanella yunxiaonensis TaxID=2829809 RepID=A0ABX7YRN9_9GAMM|nr:metalloprotease TldD [Shewanella yunxiaonensis]QUN05439.1 metalloprotease TldD [Shewanella yunxiaonensis]
MNNSTNNAITLASEQLLAPNGLDIHSLQQVLHVIHQYQVDFSDLYFKQHRQQRWLLENGQVRSGSFDVDQGVGVRAVCGDETALAYSQTLDKNALMLAAQSVRTVGHHGNGVIEIVPKTMPFASYYPAQDSISRYADIEKIALLQRIEQIARQLESRVERVIASLTLSHSTVLVMRHDGRLGADIRPMVELHATVFVKHGEQLERASCNLGGRTDLTLFTEDYLQAKLQQVVDCALTKIAAVPAPAGRMPVVLGPGWPGMLLHEAMGHGFEADDIRLGSSIYRDKLGQRIAPKGINIVDDATLVNRRGSLQMDDEGEQGQCTALIEDGILCGYMNDALNARLTGMTPTGNGRRESYSVLPMPRMTNTFMLPGQYEAAEIIASVKQGIYLAELGGGRVDTVSGQYSFESEQAYLIENGKITRPVKGATLVGSGPETLRQISMVGNDLALDNGGAICGKRGQSVAVGVGQPTLKVDNLLVGGTA